MSGKQEIFISYSHRDRKWKDLLLRHLQVLGLEGRCNIWDDTRISTGAEWLPEIQAAIDRAAVAILLISSDFLISDFIRRKEVPQFLERRGKGELRIYPIIVQACPFAHVPWLAAMQIRPPDAVPLASMRRSVIERELVSIVAEIARWLVEREAAPTEAE